MAEKKGCGSETGKRLTREGFTLVDRHHSSGSSLRQEMRILFRVARAKFDAEVPERGSIC